MASGDHQPDQAEVLPDQPGSLAAEIAALRAERRRLMAALAAQSKQLTQRTQELDAARAELAGLRGSVERQEAESIPGLSDNDWDRLVGDDDRPGV